MSYPRKPPCFIFLIILANLLSYVRSQHSCMNSGNYTNNSTYQTNLNTLLSTLSTNIGDNGFYNASWGQTPDRVNAIALCRGDIQLHLCRSCIQNATNGIVGLCPNYRHAILWLDFCMLRYSNTSIFRSTDTNPYFHAWNTHNITNPGRFMYDLQILLEDLRYQASNSGSLWKVAAQNRSTSSSTIYGMVQCTPDLSEAECDSCLSVFIIELPRINRTAVARGARILMPSCNLRYENYSFYNQTRLQELAIVPSSPPVPMPMLSTSLEKGVNLIGNIVMAVLATLFIVIGIGIILRMNRKPQEGKDEMVDDISIVESLHYDFNVIQAATNDFSEANKLGKGGFGTVYKGILSNGQEIAAKRLSNGSSQGDLEFKNEVMLLAKLQHKNLVRLLGFSLKRPEKLLVYEFVQNASLDHFIFDPTKRSHLDWGRRYKIIGGIARGIHYLHEDSRLKIIHRDLKASNILLDGEMNPKIADFGMARLFVPDESQGITNRIVGTYGYMAPEYVTRGQFSVKSDVFSFGVILLEIISGQKNNYPQHAEMDIEKDLISRVWKNWHKGTVEDLVDPVLLLRSYTPPEILRCIHIGLLCVQENATDRPTMVTVVRMLSSFSISLSVPSAPAFYMYNGNISKSSFFREFNSRRGSFNRSITNEHAKSRDPTSQNEISISDEFHAR